MADNGVVRIDVGPTKSPSAKEAAEVFSEHLTTTSRTAKGLSLIFTVDEDDEDTIDAILAALGRIRSLTIHWAGNAYTKREYFDVCLDLDDWDEDEPVPEEHREFLTLAGASSNGGDWTAVEDGSYRAPEVRQQLLDIFACGGMRQEIVRGACAAWDSGRGLSQRQVQYALEERFSQAHFTMENEAWYGGKLLQVERLLTSPIRSNIVIIYPEIRKCSVCRRLYAESDGETPRLFLLDEIERPGANIGRPLERWLPTLPPLHLHCACSATFLTSIILDVYEDTWGQRQLFITRLPSGERVPFQKEVLQEHLDVERFFGQA